MSKKLLDKIIDKNIPMEKVLRMFYLSGSIIFLIVGIANMITNITLWNNMILSAKVSSVASNLFNFVVSFVFFSFLSNEMKGMKETNIKVNPDDVDEAIEESFNK